jgi:tRNA(Ile)-lysidine synthase
MRYGFFRYLLGEDADAQDSSEGDAQDASTLDKLATGHTLDDQAETVLMRLIRGTGLRGLGGILPRIPVEAEGASAEIIRPLLGFRHRELEQYLKELKQLWREDSTNADTHFTRNRVRQLVLPLLECEFNPSVAENLAELAAIAQGEEDYWENEVAGWLGTTVHWSEPKWALDAGDRDGSLVQIDPLGGKPEVASTESDLKSLIENAPSLVMNASVSRMWLLAEPVAVQRRLVKAIGDYARIPLEFKHVEEILRFAAEDGPSRKKLPLPLGWKVVREPEELVFLTPDLSQPSRGAHDTLQDYEYDLSIPGQLLVPEAGSIIETRRIPSGPEVAGYNPEHLLDAASLSGLLRVRNWRPGDRFWPAYTKSPRKVKELLQEHHIAQPERRLWPVIVSGNEIVWMRGFPAPAKLRAKPDRDAILILEKPWAQDSDTQRF